MTLNTIPRTLVSGALSVVRLPAEGLLLVAGRGRVGSSLRFAVDRGDAGIRAVAGTLLRDEALVDDAHRRRQAAKEREHAAHLRGRAEELNVEAEAEVRDAKLQAERQREAAAERTKEREQKARQRVEHTKQGAAEVSDKRKSAARMDAAKKQDNAERESQEDRVEALEKKSAALAEKEDALTASDEARRLKDAAAKAKEQRKRRTANGEL
jgi:hypothetical protein